MAKTVPVGWQEFFGHVAEEEVTPAKWRESAVFIGKVATASGALTAFVTLAVPSLLDVASAQHAVTTGVYGSLQAVGVSSPVGAVSGWDTLLRKVLWIVDYLMDGVIIFSGISWMFGNRTKAIELLIGSGVGYIIVRHHDDIKNFFALL